MHKRLWGQLFLTYLWVPVLAMALIAVLATHLVRAVYQGHVSDELEEQARHCGRRFAPLLRAGRHEEIQRLCKEAGSLGKTRITVILPSGVVVGDSQALLADMDNHAGRDEVRQALAEGVGRSTARFSSTLQETLMYVAVAVPSANEPLGVVRTALPLRELTGVHRATYARIAAVALLAIAVHTLVTLLLSRRLSRPLEQLRAGAERFAAGDLAHRLAGGGATELDALANAMNRMAEQLDQRIQTILRQQNEREAMLSSMEEGVLAIDNQGVILSVNEACARLVDEDAGRLRGRKVYEVVRRAELLRFIEAAAASPEPTEGELRLRGAEDRWLIAHGTALHDAGRGKIGVLVMLHDVTRLRRLEDMRRDFVANVSHELRTPITSIKGFMETLLEGALDDRANAERFLRIIERQVDRLDAIITDLLTLSRIERSSDAQGIELATEPIRPVLEAAIDTCQGKAGQKQIRLELECPEDLAGQVNAALLEQAVVNLLDNAVKYSEAGAAVRVSAAADGEGLLIRVEDHGCGIEGRHLPRLFERFYRVDKARSRELGGTGLGLAIVKHIVLAHKGAVDVQSTVGEGSIFSIRLPRRVGISRQTG